MFTETWVILYDSQRQLVGDTVLHSWEALAQILASSEAEDILCDVGM